MKIVLKDGSAQEVIESKCESTKIVATFENVDEMDAFRKKLTDDNLSDFKYQKEDDIIGEYENYTFEKVEYVATEAQIEATYIIRALSELEVRVNVLEDAVADMSETVYS